MRRYGDTRGGAYRQNMRSELSSELVRKEEPSGDHFAPLRKLPAEEERGERNWSAKW
jgi:hypothetical protein